MTTAHRHTVEVAGRSIPGLIAGPESGPPVLLLHGSADSPGCWRAVMDALAPPGWRCWAPSLPAVWRPGDGDALDGDLPLLEAMIAALGPPVRLVGHSYGALAALRLALRSPGLVSHLGLFEPIAFGLLDSLPGDRTVVAELGSRVFDPVRRGEAELGLEWLVDYWNGPGAWRRLTADARRRVASGAARVAAEVASGARDQTRPDEIEALAVPTLVAAGERTTREALAVCAALAAHLTRVDHRIIAGAGHQMTRSHPQEVTEALAKLFRERA